MNNYDQNEINEQKIIEGAKENLNMQTNDTNLKINPSSDFNYQLMKRKHTSQVDLEKAQLEAQKLLAEGDIEQLMKDKLMFEKQSVSLFRIYGHLCEGIDWLFLILAIIGSIGAGISMPLMSYLTSDVYSDVGNTSENKFGNNESCCKKGYE